MFENDEEFYIKSDNTNNRVISNQTSNVDINENILENDSQQYREHISKENEGDLKNISGKENNTLEKKIKEKISKNQLQLIIFIALIVVFFSIVIVGNSMYKEVSNTGKTNNSINISNDKNSEFKFLVEVVTLSGDNSIENYNKIKETITTKENITFEEYRTNIEKVKNNSLSNLDDVNSLSNYINTKNYKEIIMLLKTRYEEIISMCNELLSDNMNNISTYNKYALSESNRVDEINNAVVKKAKSLKIDYEIKDNKIILNIQ